HGVSDGGGHRQGKCRRRLHFPCPGNPTRRCKHRLRNLAVGKVQRPHLKQVPASEPPTETRGQVDRKTVHQRLTIVGARLPVLFLLDDPATNGPIRCRDERIDGPCRCAPCCLRGSWHRVGLLSSLRVERRGTPRRLE